MRSATAARHDPPRCPRRHDCSPPGVACVDVIRGPTGQAQLLELELIEPSLFFAQAPQAAARFAACICRYNEKP